MPSRPDGLTVRRTSAGLGLFTLKPIKAGKRIIEYTGVLITNEEAERKGGKYLFGIDEKYTLDGGVPVLLVRRGGEIHAVAHTCSHMGGPLSEGKLEGEVVQCPWHGSRFNVTDGSVVDGPATFPQPCFEARVRDGQIEVRSTRD